MSFRVPSHPTPSHSGHLSTAGLLSAALIAFAANSLLCRLALGSGAVDAASFSTIRLVSGAAFLLAVSSLTGRASNESPGCWLSAAYLFAYAILFSFAYLGLSAGSGALLLFGAVQGTMLLHGFRSGERPTCIQVLGLSVAIAGLVSLVLPGVTAPPPGSSCLMMLAGAAWGIYSLRGRRASDPLRMTTGNFIRSVPLALAVSAITLPQFSVTPRGVVLAVLSGSLASGAGYVIWYTVVPRLSATTAATVQLAVPVITAFGGVIFLGEKLTSRIVLAGLAVLGGIGMVVLNRRSVLIAGRAETE